MYATLQYVVKPIIFSPVAHDRRSHEIKQFVPKQLCVGSNVTTQV